MQVLTNSKRRLVVTALVAGALTIAVPVATADVVDRAVAAKLAEQPRFNGSPDAFDRAAAARYAQTTFQGSPDAMDRLRDAQPSYAPDAFERAVISNTNSRTEAAPVVASTEVSSSGLDWSDFGLGAGLMAALLGLGVGLVAIRRSQQGMKPA
jgi:hypothetical protein